VIVVAFVFVVVLGYRIVRGESMVRKTRLGIFVERDRFPEEDEDDLYNDPKHD